VRGGFDEGSVVAGAGRDPAAWNVERVWDGKASCRCGSKKRSGHGTSLELAINGKLQKHLTNWNIGVLVRDDPIEHFSDELSSLFSLP